MKFNCNYNYNLWRALSQLFFSVPGFGFTVLILSQWYYKYIIATIARFPSFTIERYKSTNCYKEGTIPSIFNILYWLCGKRSNITQLLFTRFGGVKNTRFTDNREYGVEECKCYPPSLITNVIRFTQTVMDNFWIKLLSSKAYYEGVENRQEKAGKKK